MTWMLDPVRVQDTSRLGCGPRVLVPVGSPVIKP